MVLTVGGGSHNYMKHAYTEVTSTVLPAQSFHFCEVCLVLMFSPVKCGDVMFEFYKHVCLSLLFVYTNFIVRPSNYLQSNLGVFFSSEY